MISIADTSFLIAFSSIDRLDVLRAVFPVVAIPTLVRKEVVDQGEGWEEALSLQRAILGGSWLRTISVARSPELDSLYAELRFTGEAEVIAAALDQGGGNTVVLMDEKAGRRAAFARGLAVVGTLGVLRRAKALGVIDAAEPLLRAMVECGGVYFGDGLLAEFLEGIGEHWEPG